MKLTYERVRELLNYDPETGVFTLLIDRNKGRYKAGHVLGTDMKRYRMMEIEGEKYLAHRFAWFWMTGLWPDRIDHKDEDGFNNRWANLREATVSQNAMNHRGKSKHSLSGIRGVSFVKNRAKCGSKPWKATIMKDGKRRLIGLFTTPEEAGIAYRKVALELHGEFARAA